MVLISVILIVYRESRDRALKPRDKRSINSSSFSKQGDSPMKLRDKDNSPPEKAAGDRSNGSKSRSDGLDIRNKDQERMRCGLSREFLQLLFCIACCLIV